MDRHAANPWRVLTFVELRKTRIIAVGRIECSKLVSSIDNDRPLFVEHHLQFQLIVDTWQDLQLFDRQVYGLVKTTTITS